MGFTRNSLWSNLQGWNAVNWANFFLTKSNQVWIEEFVVTQFSSGKRAPQVIEIFLNLGAQINYTRFAWVQIACCCRVGCVLCSPSVTRRNRDAILRTGLSRRVQTRRKKRAGSPFSVDGETRSNSQSNDSSATCLQGLSIRQSVRAADATTLLQRRILASAVEAASAASAASAAASEASASPSQNLGGIPNWTCPKATLNKHIIWFKLVSGQLWTVIL